MELLPSQKLKAFFASSRPIFYKKGDIVLRVGETKSAAFYLRNGYIKDSSFSKDGREFTLFIFKPGDIFSYNWIYNKVPNIHSFKAMTDCVVIEKTREELLSFLQENSDVQFMISQNIVSRLHGLMQRIENLAFGTAAQKVCSIFVILAERFGRESKKGIYISLALTQQDISELIGLTRETTSIEIKKLINKRLIVRTSQNYIVTNIKSLNNQMAIEE